MKNERIILFWIRFKEFLSAGFLKAAGYIRLHPRLEKAIYTASAGMISIFLLHISITLAPAMQEGVVLLLPLKKANTMSEIKDPDKYIKELERGNMLLEGRLLRRIPTGSYLIINTTENHFKLYHNRKLKREGFCSTGSYIHLEADDSQAWIFKTPKGIFRIRGKTEYPVWKKPDWAFIEEGLPVPPPEHHSRFDYGVLGDYALSLGDGYLIHGTLYKRQLGMPVTHGCVRLGDEDLEVVYYYMQEGSKVFIY